MYRGQSFSQHVGWCKRETWLAYLRWLCPCFYPWSPAAICRWRFQSPTQRHFLRIGFIDNWSMPVGFFMGPILQIKGCFKTAYPPWLAGVYLDLHRDRRWKNDWDSIWLFTQFYRFWALLYLKKFPFYMPSQPMVTLIRLLLTIYNWNYSIVNRTLLSIHQWLIL